MCKMYPRNQVAGGKGRMRGIAAGPSGNCLCPNCGMVVSHQRAIPCTVQKCPKCGSNMLRE